MSEEEIIKELESLSPSETAIIGILDLYNKEKQLRKELIMQDKTELEEFKDKLRKFIKEDSFEETYNFETISKKNLLKFLENNV